MIRRAAVPTSVLLALALLAFLGGVPSATALDVGATAPEFSLKDWNERATHTLSDFKGKSNVVLIFGCASCTDYLRQIKPVNGLMKKLGKTAPVKFVTVYTREANSGWQPKTAFERQQTALMLGFAHPILTMQTIRMEVLIDDMNDAVFKAYGQGHGSVVIVDRGGKVAYKAAAVDPDAIAKALEPLL